MQLGEILFIVLYALIFSFLIFKLKFFSNFNLSPGWIAGIFLFKVIAGIGYGLIHFHLYNGGDTFAYFEDAQVIHQSLPENPSAFLKLVFGVNNRPPDLDIIHYARSMSYWNDMGSYFVIRFHALAGLLTFNHYYANTVIYNFLTLIGLLYLFRFFYFFIPEKKYGLVFLLFFFPAVAFWSSGIHKDGISLAATGLILYFSYSITGINETKNDERHQRVLSSLPVKILLFLTGCWLLFVVRSYLLILLAPCLLSFSWILKFPKLAIMKFLLTHLVFYGVLFTLQLVNPHLDFLTRIAEQQREFIRTSVGNTNLSLPYLEPDILSFIKIVPVSLTHCLFHPAPWEITSLLQVSSAIDNLIVWSLVVFAVFLWKKHAKNQNALLLFSLFFACSIFIFVGSIVPNLGALVRYKMPGMLFLAVGCLAAIDYEKVKASWKKIENEKDVAD